MTEWDEFYRDDPEHVEVPDQILSVETADLAPGHALDLGCGLGTNALALVRRGWHVHGIDISPRAIQLARERAAPFPGQACFEVADTSQWSPGRIYDLVTSTFALPSGRGGERVLETAARATAPGGCLLVVEWDVSMRETWGWAEMELFSPTRIADHLPGLDIECAAVRDLTELYPVGDPRRAHWVTNSAYVAFVRARRA